MVAAVSGIDHGRVMVLSPLLQHDDDDVVINNEIGHCQVLYGKRPGDTRERFGPGN